MGKGARKLVEWTWGDGCALLEDHVVIGVVEGVTSHHPHQPRMHQSPVGRPAQRLSGWFDARQHPEGLGGGDGERAVWTWGGQRDTFTQEASQHTNTQTHICTLTYFKGEINSNAAESIRAHPGCCGGRGGVQPEQVTGRVIFNCLDSGATSWFFCE